MARIKGASYLILLAVCPSHGQNNTSPPTFEAASIKPARPDGPEGVSTSRSTHGRAEFHAVNLREAIAIAYRVKEYQVAGPAWLGEQEWEIVAKLPEGAPQSQMPDMMQTLLASRFKLQVHHDKKEVSGLALVVAGGGPKLKKADEATAAGRGRGGFRMSTGPSGGRMIAPRATMAMLATTVSILMGMPVFDDTHLDGTYNIDLEYGPDDLATAARSHAASNPAPASAPADDAAEPRPSIYTSIQKLGLKLEARKVPVDVIVVDHAEKTPSEN